MFSILVGSALLAVVFVFIGYFKLTRLGQFLPASLLAGFIACIGYKTALAAMKTACGKVRFGALAQDLACASKPDTETTLYISTLAGVLPTAER